MVFSSKVDNVLSYITISQLSLIDAKERNKDLLLILVYMDVTALTITYASLVVIREYIVVFSTKLSLHASFSMFRHCFQRVLYVHVRLQKYPTIMTI